MRPSSAYSSQKAMNKLMIASSQIKNNIPMKKYLYLISTLVILVTSSISCKTEVEGPPPTAPAATPNTQLSSTATMDIYAKGTEGYSCFRIPAIVKTKQGTLLAFAEARKTNCADNGNIDLVVKRSTDEGATWGPLITIWDDGSNTCGNPVPVVDQSTGNIHLVMSWNVGSADIGAINNGTAVPRRAYATSSTNDGLTWATPSNISSTTMKPDWGWLSTGPGHGIQLTKGQHAGRLVIPGCFITVNAVAANRDESAFIMYSDDHGTTWKSGGIADPANYSPSETTVAELADGKLLMNSRCTGKNYRISSVSTDGGATWSVMRAEYPLIDPVNQGSLLAHTLNAEYTLFFSNAASTSRTNMAITTSKNNGENWAKRFIVNSGQVAYSDLVITSEKHIGIMYETGIVNPYELIRFETFALDSFK